MEDKQDFLIANGVLLHYYGPGGDVVIPEGVTEIGRRAFEGCHNLTSVTIPASVIGIGMWAFENCTSLTNVTIPKGVAVIGERAFEGCSGLRTVTVLQGTDINSSAFLACDGLADKLGMIVVNGILCAYIGSGGDVAIPENVTRIGEDVFAMRDSLTSVTIPEGVTEIGARAFDSCANLTSVTIPESAIIIDEMAFAGCGSLTNLSIPASITDIGAGAFLGCDGLADEQGMVIVNGIMFDYNGPGVDVTIPAGVTAISGWDFSYGDSVTIPESVIEIDLFEYGDNLIIRAPARSYAEWYATECGIPFEPIPGQQK